MSDKPVYANREEASQARIERLHQSYEQYLANGNRYQTAIFGARLLEALLHERHMKAHTGPGATAAVVTEGNASSELKETE